MFSTVARHVRPVLQSQSVARAMQLAQPVTRTLTRLPSAASLAEIPARISATSTSNLARALSTGAPKGDPARDWPAAGDAWDGVRQISPAGVGACRAALGTPLAREAVRAVQRERAYRTGEGIDPALSEQTTRIGMALGLDRTPERLTRDEGPGVAAGLQALAIGPGDGVAEHDPDLPGLSVRLAHDGARVGLALSHPARLREVSGELERFRDGKPMIVQTMGPDLKPVRTQEEFIEGARAAARQLTVVPGPGLRALPEDVRLKAVISRGAFDHLPLPAIQAVVREAGSRLQHGGGLVFDFTHAASRPVAPKASERMGRIRFRDIEEALRDAGLGLQSLYVTFRLADQACLQALPTRRVLADQDGRIPLHKADAAAWSGWDEFARQPGLAGRPLQVGVSGLFLKDGKAKG